MSDPEAILDTDARGVLQIADAVLATIDADGNVDEDAYVTVTAEMTLRGYRTPVLVVWAQALAFAHVNRDQVFAQCAGSVPAPARRRVLRHADQVMRTAQEVLVTPGAYSRLPRQVERTCRRLGPRCADLARLMAVATRPTRDTFGGSGGLEQLYKVAALVLDTSPQQAIARALAPATAMLAAVAAGHPDHAARQLDASRPRELLTVLVPAQFVLTSRTHVAVTVSPDGTPDSAGDPAEVNDPAFALTYRLVDVSTNGTQQQLAAAIDEVFASSKHDIELIAWYLPLSIGSRLGQHFASSALRSTAGLLAINS